MKPSLYTVKGILIMGSDSKRIFGKYYDDQLQNLKDQKQFEKTLFQKTHKANSEIIMLGDVTVVYRICVDLLFYVIGSIDENEIMLMNLLNCLCDTIKLALRKNVEKKTMCDNLDLIFLIIDEMCDQGIITDVDPNSIAQRVLIKNEDHIPLSEQTVVDVLRAILK
jgi:hypothetical protein